MTPETLRRLYSNALNLNQQNARVIEELRRENALLRKTNEEQRQLLRAMEEGYSMRRTA